jgi:hypothetical protein
MTYAAGFVPDYNASPAKNARGCITGLEAEGMPGAPELFGDLSLQHAARSKFLYDGKLDTERIYRELITGKDFEYEENELLRSAIMLNPTKEEMAELIAYAMDGKHGAHPPSPDSKEILGWARNELDVFGISIEDIDPATRDRILTAKA